MSVCRGLTDWLSDCWARYNKPMTPREYLRLNAWQKWRLFRRPPWKFIINIFIIICCTTQVVLLNTYFAPFNRANIATFNYLLEPRSNPSGDEFGTQTTWHIYQLDDLVDGVKQTLEVYFTIHEQTIDYFEYFFEDGDPSHPQPVELEITTYEQGPSIFDLTTPFSSRTITRIFQLVDEDDLGPFAPDADDRRFGLDLSSYVHIIQSFTLNFKLRSHEFTSSHRSCYQWDVQQVFDFSTRGRIDMNVETSTQLCPQESRTPWYQRSWSNEAIIYVIIAILAIISQILHLKALYRSIIIFQEARLATFRKQNESKQLKLRQQQQQQLEIQRHQRLMLDGDMGDYGDNSDSLRRRNPLSMDSSYDQYHRSDDDVNRDNLTSSLLPSQLVGSDDYDGDYDSQQHQQQHHPRINPSTGETIVTAESELAQETAVSAWTSLSFRDKLRFFNVWLILATIGNICNISAAFLNLRAQLILQHNSSIVILLGLGTMMAWVCFVQCFEGAHSYYVLITTLRKGTPRVGRFLVGVFPIFLAYSLFGVSLFSAHSDNFATIDAACVTLFSLLNGDVVHDIFDDIYPVHPVISRIYLYTFICLFIYAVLNIFIAIIEDAFFASKAFQLHAQPQLQYKEKDDNVDPLLLLQFEGLFGDGDPINEHLEGFEVDGDDDDDDDDNGDVDDTGGDDSNADDSDDRHDDHDDHDSSHRRRHRRPPSSSSGSSSSSGRSRHGDDVDVGHDHDLGDLATKKAGSKNKRLQRQ